MTTAATYPKRLIEVDLPIKRISAHARREKSIRHGHISTLHMWWARRPLAACRAVICAALWPDPADPLCPDAFRLVARDRMQEWANQHLALVSRESYAHFNDIRNNPAKLDHDDELLRTLLLDFIADFANWDNSPNEAYLEASHALTQAAHEALGGEPGSRPLVVDPFAGGGAIPLEALRVGADAFASDLNPVAVLLNKVVLEYIPKYGQRLADEVRKWGQWVKEEAEKELAEFYPKDPDGATPIAYLWARTIRCEGPDCGAEVPLIRSLWLAKRSKGAAALRLIPNHNEKRLEFQITHDAKAKDVAEGTVRKGSATCPVCGFTTAVASVRRQLKEYNGGASNARLFCVVTVKPGELGRQYRQPSEHDIRAVDSCAKRLANLEGAQVHGLSLIPDEPLDVRGIRHTWAMLYGMDSWASFFTARQGLAIATIAGKIRDLPIENDVSDPDFASAVRTALALCVDKVADLANTCCRWEPVAQCPRQLFARQAIPFIWDFAEGVPIGSSSGSFSVMLDRFDHVLEQIGANWRVGTASAASATKNTLPDSTADAFITDPPYYDAVPYAYLSDFFYVWLRRCLAANYSDLFADMVVPKDDEIVVDRPHELSNSTHDIEHYERELVKAFTEGRRTLKDAGVSTIVFASKTTTSWEAILNAVVDAGWTITGSWPIDTEMETRVAAQGQARLSSSVHLVCRPRNTTGAFTTGDWRDVLAELPRRIHEWMPRLVSEGIVGADAIFACLGPAVEIFSRFERVEKASGEVVTLREYLPYVWAAVSREALGTIFDQANATGFEEDARLTALWLWTLFGGQMGQALAEVADTDNEDEGAEEEDDSDAKKPAAGGNYALEFDAARKLAQGLGAHLERLTSVIEIKGEKARLLPVAERARVLFGKESTEPVVTSRRRSVTVQAALPGFPSKPHQSSFGDLLDDAATAGGAVDEGWIDTSAPEPGETVLDRLHQGMLLFAAGRTEALRRFLIENGIGRDERFWRLAQALSALYPMGSDEKRWVDGVLARKKGWGL